MSSQMCSSRVCRRVGDFMYVDPTIFDAAAASSEEEEEEEAESDKEDGQVSHAVAPAPMPLPLSLPLCTRQNHQTGCSMHVCAYVPKMA